MVKQVDYAPSADIPYGARPQPVKFSGLKLLLPPGMNIGNSSTGSFCMSPGYPINRNEIKKAIDTKFLRQSFHDAMESNGYDVTGSLNIVFEPEDEEQRAEYSIGGKLKDVQLDMCISSPSALNVFAQRPGESGEIYIAIDWSIYDRLKRHVVYSTKSEGYSKRDIPNLEGLSVLFDDAFEMAVHNLAADEQLRALIFNGVKPKFSPFGRDARGEKIDQRPRLFDSQEEVALPALPLSRQPFAKTAEDGKQIGVMLQKGGHGSGFFISRNGHILTNAHVVGEARKMRIVTAHRKTGITAEVLRVDRTRDVALLKLEEIPDWLDITTLPIRLDWPKIGEDIYAIGVPKDYKSMRTTVTKGITSAHRKEMKYEGVRLNFFQGDVEVHPGSSGGPVLDEYGNIVGLSVLGLTHGGEDSAPIGIGLNLFIPIKEALDTLDIDYGQY